MNTTVTKRLFDQIDALHAELQDLTDGVLDIRDSLEALTSLAKEVLTQPPPDVG